MTLAPETIASGRSRQAGAGAVGARDVPVGENFPIASRLLPRRMRGQVMAFYGFARCADDIADDSSLPPESRIARLDALERSLAGDGESDDPGATLRRFLDGGRDPRQSAALAAAHDLLPAFRRDAHGTRCRDWADLMSYCGSSAMPVGRFLLALDGEDARAHPPSDALCAALQVLNHLQDIAADWRDLGRCYLPGDWMAAEAVPDADLARSECSPGLRRVIDRTLGETDVLLDAAAPLPSLIARPGLRAQAATTLTLACRLRGLLGRSDPLAVRVALRRTDFLRAGLVGLWAAR